MNKALLAFVLSPVCIAVFADNHVSKGISKPIETGVDSSIVMQDVTVLGNRQKDIQMRSSVPRGSKAYDASQEIQIPATVEPGDYHFVIRLTDQAGHQQIRAMTIKIK